MINRSNSRMRKRFLVKIADKSYSLWHEFYFLEKNRLYLTSSERRIVINTKKNMYEHITLMLSLVLNHVQHQWYQSHYPFKYIVPLRLVIVISFSEALHLKLSEWFHSYDFSIKISFIYLIITWFLLPINWLLWEK
jgi:hypothetical protein